MKRRLNLLIVLLMPLVSVAANDRSKDRSTEYKCHFVMADGAELVNYMMSKDNYARQLEQGMVNKAIFAKDGQTKRRISQVKECIKANQEFKTFDARQLDKTTLS